MNISRRSILLPTAIAIASPFSFGRALRSPKARAIKAEMRLRALIPNPVDARPIGIAYVALFPREADVTALTESVLSSLSLNDYALAALDDRSLSDLVRRRVLADFEQSCTVEIKGWILSRTEARLYALWA
jgi:hypothetical protein